MMMKTIATVLIAMTMAAAVPATARAHDCDTPIDQKMTQDECRLHSLLHRHEAVTPWGLFAGLLLQRQYGKFSECLAALQAIRPQARVTGAQNIPGDYIRVDERGALLGLRIWWTCR